jgi:hypothetical protein
MGETIRLHGYPHGVDIIKQKLVVTQTPGFTRCRVGATFQSPLKCKVTTPPKPVIQNDTGLRKIQLQCKDFYLDHISGALHTPVT